MKLIIAVLTVVVLSGCVTDDLQMEINSNANQIAQLSQRISALESQQHLLDKKVADNAIKTPSGVVAIPTRRDGSNLGMNQPASLALGIAQFRAGDVNGAVATLTQVLQVGVPNEQIAARYWLGNAAYTQRQFDQANRYLGQYIHLAPQGEYVGRALRLLISSLRASGRDADADILQRDGVSAIVGQ